MRGAHYYKKIFWRRAKLVFRGGFSVRLASRVTVNERFIETDRCLPLLIKQKINKKRQARPQAHLGPRVKPICRCPRCRQGTAAAAHAEPDPPRRAPSLADPPSERQPRLGVGLGGRRAGSGVRWLSVACFARVARCLDPAFSPPDLASRSVSAGGDGCPARCRC